MKYHYLFIATLLLGGCTLNKTADIVSTDPTAGVVSLGYSLLPFNDGKVDDSLTQSTAIQQCQKWGYSTALRYGETKTCTVFSGPQCLNYEVQLDYQCRGTSGTPYSVVTSNW
ncbi:YecR family lipoprotein [uncultured Cedecea sp.]|uniref:YecR family lipoprotein n=1 Tax=uncultured Cedecea sp. TaxID=988762 RepID=UPI00260D4FE3|nr:YecR family lipoprotein [uncultured Cedecea sp.]